MKEIKDGAKMKKTEESLQLQVLDCYKRGLNASVTARILNMPRRTVAHILSKNMIPKNNFKNVSGVSIEKLISPRLFFYCNDLELLSKRLAAEVLYKKPEKIIIPKRLLNVIKKEKINKVISILDKVNLKCEVEYA